MCSVVRVVCVEEEELGIVLPVSPRRMLMVAGSKNEVGRARSMVRLDQLKQARMPLEQPGRGVDEMIATMACYDYR